ncbi:hypothetical protein V5O48_017683 [Marasmius crinis-equi]|uniref:Uncharacterized protein n=1 Tax=Marasmius crinis-equi TaxID=585013 RepID=A0ABR3ENG7_9AGAR
MRSFSTLLASFLLPISLTSLAIAQKCRQPAEYAAAIQNFGKLLVQSDGVLNGTIPPPWAPDVIGRVDVTTTFIGQELNTDSFSVSSEYFFGLFNEAKNFNTTQIIDSPVNATLVELVIEPPMAYASVIIDFLQRTIDFTLPLQVDFLLRFDKNLLISSYDATVRRFPQASKFILPQLAVKMAEELNVTITPQTNVVKEVIARRAAVDICTLETQFCLGNDKQYDDYDACYQFLTEQVPFGDPWEGGFNNTWCRYIHKNMLKFRPDVHCPHVGPTGGGMCVDRDYIDTVENPPFNESLIASSAGC